MAERSTEDAVMDRRGWLEVVLNEADSHVRSFGTSVTDDDSIDAEMDVSLRATARIAASRSAYDFIRYSGLGEPPDEIWRGASNWSDAVVAAACACLEYDIKDAVRRMASGELPAIGGVRIN